MEYLSYSSSDSESDHEDVQDNTDIQDYPELTLVDDLRSSLHITDRDGWYILCFFIEFTVGLKSSVRTAKQEASWHRKLLNMPYYLEIKHKANI